MKWKVIKYSTRIQNFPRENSIELINNGLSNPDVLLKTLGLEDLKIVDINQTDGLRFTFDDKVIVHLRPSGNAPELRCYVETNNQEFSEKIVKQVLLSIRDSL